MWCLCAKPRFQQPHPGIGALFSLLHIVRDFAQFPLMVVRERPRFREFGNFAGTGVLIHFAASPFPSWVDGDARDRGGRYGSLCAPSVPGLD
jgi:hypothetical protein